MKIIIITLVSIFLWATCIGGTKPNIEPVVNLSGYWKFNIGDDMNWAKKDFNDSEWDEIYAPAKWENEGYVEYDGYAWYRKKINIPSTENNDYLYLYLGKIDDVNQVFFNGTSIGQAGIFPPHYVSAYNVPLLYAVPKSLIKFNGENTIAIRVYDEKQDGGLVEGNLVLGYDVDIHLLSQNLAGTWKISFHHEKGYYETNFNDSKWENITVPATWESQGYNDYDGTGYYRKSFELNGQLANKSLYLILGKIDDRDRVYINGEFIGSTNDMYDTSLANRYDGDWQIRRAYKIPSGLLKTIGKNTIVVVVEDYEGMGGIFEGPVGLMTMDQYSFYLDKYRNSIFYRRYNSFWSLFFD